MSDNSKMADALPVQGDAEGGLVDPVQVSDAMAEVLADTPVVAQPSVGQQLRAARLEAKLSITDVAQALKFSPRQIELLEQDAHADLPGMTIVRGFVRSYSRLLKLDTTALLKILDEASPWCWPMFGLPITWGWRGLRGSGRPWGP